MAFPKFQSIFLPLLNFASDEKEHSIREAIEKLSTEFDLNKNDLNHLLSNWSNTVFYQRVTWAITYLKKAGLLDSNRKGHFHITNNGLDLLSQNPSKIDTNFLLQYPEFAIFKRRPLKPKE